MPYTNIPAVNTNPSQPQFRDRLFKAIFGRDTEQSKRWRLDLYSAQVDCRKNSGCFEWTCEMININKNHNSALQKKYVPLYNYINFVSRVNKNKENGLSAKDAVNEAVEWAIGENLLEGFFQASERGDNGYDSDRI